MAQWVKAPAAKPDTKVWSQHPKWCKNSLTHTSPLPSTVMCHTQISPPLLYINEYIRSKMKQYWDDAKTKINSTKCFQFSPFEHPEKTMLWLSDLQQILINSTDINKEKQHAKEPVYWMWFLPKPSLFCTSIFHIFSALVEISQWLLHSS